MSKSLDKVVKTKVPVSVATHLYQIDALGAYPPCVGSPDSRVEVSVELNVKLFAPEIAIAPENGSFESDPIVVIGEVALVGTPVPAELVAWTRKI